VRRRDHLDGDGSIKGKILLLRAMEKLPEKRALWGVH
jgi:hypothetical protein